jgi:hypothetical protein
LLRGKPHSRTEIEIVDIDNAPHVVKRARSIGAQRDRVPHQVRRIDTLLFDHDLDRRLRWNCRRPSK